MWRENGNFVRWCNGSTTDFGSVSLGSSPGQTSHEKVNLNSCNLFGQSMCVCAKHPEGQGLLYHRKAHLLRRHLVGLGSVEWNEYSDSDRRYKGPYHYLLSNDTNIRYLNRRGGILQWSWWQDPDIHLCWRERFTVQHQICQEDNGNTDLRRL